MKPLIQKSYGLSFVREGEQSPVLMVMPLYNVLYSGADLWPPFRPSIKVVMHLQNEALQAAGDIHAETLKLDRLGKMDLKALKTLYVKSYAYHQIYYQKEIVRPEAGFLDNVTQCCERSSAMLAARAPQEHTRLTQALAQFPDWSPVPYREGRLPDMLDLFSPYRGGLG